MVKYTYKYHYVGVKQQPSMRNGEAGVELQVMSQEPTVENY